MFRVFMARRVYRKHKKVVPADGSILPAGRMDEEVCGASPVDDRLMNKLEALLMPDFPRPPVQKQGP